MQPNRYPGMQAISLMNNFLLKHKNVLLTLGQNNIPKHRSLARGSEGVPNDLLSTEHAFGGDFHAKLRRIGGMHSELVDRDALPQHIQKVIEELDTFNTRYREKITVLEKMVEKEAIQNSDKDYSYHDDEGLYVLAMGINPDLTKATYREIRKIVKDAEPVIEKYHQGLNNCDTVPLRIMTSPDAKTKKTAINASIPNTKHDIHEAFEQYSLLETLLMAGYQQKAIASRVNVMTGIDVPNGEEHLLSELKELFDTHIIYNKDAEEVLNAFDKKLLQEAQRNLTQLNKKYGTLLGESSPKIYNDFCHLQQQIGLQIDASILDGTSEQEALPHTKIEERKVTDKGLASHPCPHLARMGIKLPANPQIRQ